MTPDPYADLYAVVTVKKTSPGCYRIARNGKVLGDSRGYDFLMACVKARHLVERDHADAVRFDRPVLLTLGELVP